jgi:hypothetical protein
MQPRIAAGGSTVAGLSLAALLLGAGAASASSPAGPPLAGTTQTIFIHPTKSGSTASTSITFKTKTFSNGFKDHGTYAISGSTLTMKVTSSRVGDKGCAFTGTYQSSSTEYAGKYTCPGGFHDTFAVTTTGS